jgi:putative transposase
MKRNRKSIRLKNYDYSQPGAYFVTICTNNRECLLGEIINGKIQLTDAGLMVHKWFLELSNKFTNMQCIEFVIMPNHLHFIVFLNTGNKCQTNIGQTDRSAHTDSVDSPIFVGANLCVRPNTPNTPNTNNEPTMQTINTIIQWFKTMTINEYIRNVKQNKWQPFDGKLWQRNYYEHIIRNEDELNRIRKYIINNPINWKRDRNK